MAIFTHIWSHDMRHTGFPQVDGGQWNPWEMGRHICNANVTAISHVTCMMHTT